jgi:hypothetical protein
MRVASRRNASKGTSSSKRSGRHQRALASNVEGLERLSGAGRPGLPGGLTAQSQVVHVKAEPAERSLAVHPRTHHQSAVHRAEAARSRASNAALLSAGPKPSSLSRMRAARSAGARLIGWHGRWSAFQGDTPRHDLPVAWAVSRRGQSSHVLPNGACRSPRLP